MKQLFISLALALTMVSFAGNESGHGGDKVIRTFAEGWVLAQRMVSTLSLENMTSESEQEQAAIAWFAKNQENLLDDMKKSPQEWVKQETDYTLCGKTARTSKATLYLYKENCKEYSVRDAAAHFIGESVHHFDKDELFSALVANLVATAFEKPPTIQSQRRANELALVKAAESGDLGEVKRLLSPPLSVNPNCRDAENKTPFFRADDNFAVATYLLNHGAIPDLVIYPSSYPPSTAFSFLYAIDPENAEQTELLKLMVEKSQNPEYGKRMMLERAIYAHHRELANWILETTNPAQATLSFGLKVAVNLKSSWAIEKILGKEKWDVRQIHPALVAAAETNQLDVAQRLIQSGADLNFDGGDGRSAQSVLVAAALNFPLFRQLVEMGADPGKKHSHGKTSILFEVLGTKRYLRNWLLEEDRNTHFTIPSFATVEYLLSLPEVKASGASPVTGQTTLHRLVLSTVQPRPDLIQGLISKGADPNAKDIEGFTALDYAKKIHQAYYQQCHGHPEVFNQACWKLHDQQLMTLTKVTSKTTQPFGSFDPKNDIPNDEVGYAVIKDGVASKRDFFTSKEKKRFGSPWCMAVAKHCQGL